MHSHRRSRGKVLFEALCALGLAASFAGASDQTGSSALLASAAIMALFAIYWAFGLVARDRTHRAEQPGAAVEVQPSATVAEAREAAVEADAGEEACAREPQAPATNAVDVVPFEPDVPAEPAAVAPAPKKKRARKAKKAAADAAPVVEKSEPGAFGEPVAHGVSLEPLFEPQPFVRQPRAFGRKARGPRTLPV